MSIPTDYNHINSKFSIGNVRAAHNTRVLPHFKTIVRLNDCDAAQTLKDEYNTLGLRYLYRNVSDSVLPSQFETIASEINNSPKPLLIHCEMGRSRSVAALIAYFMIYENISLTDAYYLIKEKRGSMDINPRLYSALLKIEKK